MLPAPLISQTGSNPIPTLFDYLNRKKTTEKNIDQDLSIQNLATPETLGNIWNIAMWNRTRSNGFLHLIEKTFISVLLTQVNTPIATDTHPSIFEING